MSLSETMISVLAGLFGGALGGVATAGKIAHSGERARARFRAEEHISAAVRIYRATMTFDHDLVHSRGQFPVEYTSVAGQEEFAGNVLGCLSALPRKTRDAIETELQILIGCLAFDLAAHRANVPEGRLLADQESRRQELALYQVLNSPQGVREGTLRRMIATQNSVSDHDALYKSALTTLDRMLAEVAHRGPRWERPLITAREVVSRTLSRFRSRCGR